jgi:hypothetical protein
MQVHEESLLLWTEEALEDALAKSDGRKAAALESLTVNLSGKQPQVHSHLPSYEDWGSVHPRAREVKGSFWCVALGGDDDDDEEEEEDEEEVVEEEDA